MAISQSELLTSGVFVTDCAGVDVELALPTWMPRGYAQEDLDAFVARHGVEAILNLVYAQAIIDLRARVRFMKRKTRTTKNGEESITPKSDRAVKEALEAVKFNAPRDEGARKMTAAEKMLAGLTPEQIAAVLLKLGGAGA